MWPITPSLPFSRFCIFMAAWALSMSLSQKCYTQCNVQLTLDHAPDPICYGDTVRFVAHPTNGVPPYTYAWSTPAMPSWNFDSIGYLVANGGFNYSVTVTDDNGCTAVASYNYKPPLTHMVVNAVTNCHSEQYPYEISVNSIGTGGTISWSTGETTQTILGSPGIIYTVTVTVPNGCSRTLSIGPLPAVFFPDVDLTGPPTICLNTLGQISATPGPGWIYEWSTGSSGLSNTTNIIGPGIYAVTITVPGYECPAEDTIEVGTTPPIPPLLNSPPFLCPGTIGTVAVVNSSIYSQFSWETGQSTSDILVQSGAPYSVTVTEPNGCTSVASGTVEEFFVQDPIVTALPDICEGQEEWEWQVVPPFASYQWSTGETTSSITIDEAGTYALTVTDANGCTTTTIQEVEAAPMPNPSIPQIPVVCNGSPQQITVQGGPFETFEWSTGATTSSIQVSQAGTYSVTVTNVRNCSATAEVDVNIGFSPTAAVTVSPTGCNGTASLNATGGTFFLWSTGENSATINTATNGSYTVTVTDNNGCTATAIGSVSIPAPPLVQVSGPTGLCSGNMANLAATGGFVSYLWSNGEATPSIATNQSGSYSVTATNASGCTATDDFSIVFYPLPTASINGPTTFCTGSNAEFSLSGNYASVVWGNGATTPTITVNQPGNYSVTVTDAQGCTASDSQILTLSTSLSFDIVQTIVGCSGSASLDAGSGFDTYLWSNGATSPTISVTQAGGYAVTVSDGNGCTGEAVSSVAFPDPPVVVISGPATACVGTSVSLAADAGFNAYLWSTGETTASVNVSQPGNFIVTITDATGCTATASQQFAVLSPPTVNVVGPTAICTGGTADLMVSGNFTQAMWSTGQTGNAISVTQPGNYSVAVTDAAGCTATASHQFSVLAPPNIALVGPTTICTGGVANFIVSGNFTQAIWSTGETSNTISVSLSGNYSVVVTDANGCTANASQSLTVSTSLSPDIAQTVQPCTPSATLDAGAGYASYLWSNGAATPTISVSQPGDYTVTVSDGSGCTGAVTENISLPTLPQVGILGSTSICTNGSTVFSVSSNFPQITWSTGEVTSTISVSQPGSYAVTVTDANGCTASATQALSVDTSLSPDIVTANLGCNGTASLDAGAGLYESYIWSNGETTPVINVSQAGTYTVTVSDGSGCTGATTENISFPTPPQVQVVGPAAICSGGSATFSLSGNFAAVTWSTGSTASSINISQPGNYSVTVTDANGCTAIGAQSLTLNALPVPDITASNLGCDGTGSLGAGTGFSSYLWSNGAVTPTINITQSGNYAVTVTNASGCTGIDQLAINLPVPPQTGISGPAQLCEGYTVTLIAPANFANYLWSTSEISSGITITTGGQYGLTVTDGNGCTATAAWEVTLLPTQYSFFENSSCSLLDTGTVVTTLTSQTGCDSLVTVTTLLNPSLTENLLLTACPGASALFNGVSIPAGSVQDFVFTSQQGCDSILTVTVAELAGMSLDWQATPSCWNGSNGSVKLLASAGTPPFRYSLDGSSFQSNALFSGLPAGSYAVLVEDENGCGMEMPLEIPATLPTAIVLEDEQLHCGEGSTQLEPQVVGGDAQVIAWRWSTGAETQNLQVSTPGIFTLTADDGCEVQSFTVTVMPDADWDRSYFYVPSSFSPNSDGLNDHFMPFVGQEIEVRSFEFKVFDRWGNSMYTTTETTDIGWDGLHRTDQMQNAVYVWFLKAIVADCMGEDKDIFKEGGVTIVR